MFGFGKKKPVCDCPTPCNPCKCDSGISIMTNGLPKVPVITKAFGFKTNLTYKDGDKTNTWQWHSDLYYDYRSAVQASYDIVKTISDEMLRTTTDKYAFFIDSCLIRDQFMTATSTNVNEYTFHDGKLVAETEILVDAGSNIILPHLRTEQNQYNKA